MIFGRTLEDTNLAKEILQRLKNKEVSLDELTAEEVETLERGTITVNTLNRIENKISELKTRYLDMGYFVGNLQIKNWSNGGEFKANDFERILDNINALREAYYVYLTTPRTPSASYRVKNINDIEQILDDLDGMIDDVALYTPECGNAYCG